MCHCWGLETCIFVSNQSLVFSFVSSQLKLKVIWGSECHQNLVFLKLASCSFTFCYIIWHLVGFLFLSITISDNSIIWYFGLAGTSGGCKSEPPGCRRGTSKVSPGSGLENLQGQGLYSLFSAWTPCDPTRFCFPQCPSGNRAESEPSLLKVTRVIVSPPRSQTLFKKAFVSGKRKSRWK